MKTSGRRNSHFAKSTFCWFPPESVFTAALGDRVRTSSRVDRARRAPAFAAATA